LDALFLRSHAGAAAKNKIQKAALLCWPERLPLQPVHGAVARRVIVFGKPEHYELGVLVTHLVSQDSHFRDSVVPVLANIETAMWAREL
jgi:hypothetical protein